MAGSNEKLEKSFKGIVAKSLRATGRIIAEPRKTLSNLSDAIAIGIEDRWSLGFINLFQKLTEEKKLDPDWLNSTEGRFLFQKARRELHSSASDERILEAKISMFLGIISSKFKGHSEVEAREAWRTVGELGIQDVVLLGAIFRLSEDSESEAHTLTGSRGWTQLMARESGLNYEQPVSRAASILVSQGLIYPESIQITGLKNKSRITAWGLCVAGYLAEGKKLLEESREAVGLD